MSYNAKEHKQAKKLHKIHFSKKWIIIIILIICSAVGGGLFVLNHYSTVSNGSKTETTRVEIKKLLDSEVKKSGAKAGQDLLTTKSNETSNSQEKSQIYIEKAVLAGSVVGSSDNTKALEYAYQAEKYYPNKETAYSVAFYEEKLGNIINAIKYYKLYMDRLSNSEDDRIDFDYYSAYVKKLEAGDK